MASEPTRSSSTTTRASCTPRRGKRRKASLAPVAANKRRHRAQQDGENQGVDDECVIGEARAGLEQRLLQFGACTCLPRALLEHGEELIPASSAPFYRQVRDISHSIPKELCWTPEALLVLRNEAECYLAEVFRVVDQLARAVMAQPIPWYHKNTRLTLEQEEAAFALSCGTSGIPVYVLKIVEYHVSKQLVLSAEYCQRFLAPRLGSETGQTKIFCDNNPTGSEVCFSVKNDDLRLLKGWRNFVKTNCIKEGDKYALTFEEDEEGI